MRYYRATRCLLARCSLVIGRCLRWIDDAENVQFWTAACFSRFPTGARCSLHEPLSCLAGDTPLSLRLSGSYKPASVIRFQNVSLLRLVLKCSLCGGKSALGRNRCSDRRSSSGRSANAAPSAGCTGATLARGRVERLFYIINIVGPHASIMGAYRESPERNRAREGNFWSIFVGNCSAPSCLAAVRAYR